MKTIGFIGCGNMGGALARAVCRVAAPEDVVPRAINGAVLLTLISSMA